MIRRNTSKHSLDLRAKLAQSLAKGPESSMNKTTVDVSTAVRSAGAWRSPARFASRERKLTHALDSLHPSVGTAGRRVPARGSARRPPVQRGGIRARGALAAVRYLRLGRHTVRSGLQHYPRAIRLLRRAALPGP